MRPGAISARVGGNIRHYRTERGMTQEKLAQLLTGGGLEVSDAAVSRLEAGQRGITVDHLVAVAEVLDCAPADLLEVEPPARPLPLPMEAATQASLDLNLIHALADLVGNYSRRDVALALLDDAQQAAALPGGEC